MSDTQPRGVTAPGTNAGSFKPDEHGKADTVEVTVMPISDATFYYPPPFHTAQECLNFWTTIPVPDAEVDKMYNRQWECINKLRWNYAHYGLGVSFSDKDAEQAGDPNMLAVLNAHRQEDPHNNFFSSPDINENLRWQWWIDQEYNARWAWRNNQLAQAQAFIENTDNGLDDGTYYHLKRPARVDAKAILRCIKMGGSYLADPDEREKLRSHSVQLPSGQTIKVRDAWNNYGGYMVTDSGRDPLRGQPSYEEFFKKKQQAARDLVSKYEPYDYDQYGNYRPLREIIEDHQMGL